MAADPPSIAKTPKKPAGEWLARGERLRTVLLELGVMRSVAYFAAICCLASVLLSWLILSLVGASDEVRAISLPIAAIVPLLIAPPVVWLVATLMYQIEDARAAIHDVAIRDGLTHLFNRAHFMEVARTEITKAARYATPLSLMIIDADDFKRVNDHYGHQAGDAVLQAIASTCAACLREHDILARYGGEEFVVLLPATGKAGAQRVAEKLRAAIEAVRVEAPPHKPLAVTVSIGLSSLRDAEHDLDALFGRADAALYQSKREGKNRWTEH